MMGMGPHSTTALEKVEPGGGTGKGIATDKLVNQRLC